MGKKDKKKNKMSGVEKTALKTEKKLSAKQKKELAALGEESIEQIVAQIEQEEAKRNRIVEAVVEQPSRRVNFSLTAHPFKDELIMLGGEFYDGQKTTVYGDLFFYNIIKKEWTVLKAPGAPPPRCSHQAVAIPTNKGELWVFGGEFTSPSESQFYHYKDLWVFYFDTKSWKKITAPGGPSPRSGHRMVYLKKQLFIFGGFHDNLRDCKYFNDIHCFNLSTYTWTKLEILGIPPAPRSGCIVLPTPDAKILVYGGYSKEKLKKDVDKGQVHTDMFSLNPDKNDQTGLKWKWTSVKQSGIRPSPRCSMSAILVQPDIAYMFGGVYDEEDTEEDLRGTFFNDLMSFNLNKHQWHDVILNGKSDNTQRRRRRKEKEDGSEDKDEEEDEMKVEEEAAESIVIDDGIFTLKINNSAPESTPGVSKVGGTQSVFTPSPRINCGLVMKRNILYMYGGMLEENDKQYTLNDFYSLDCKKLDEWNTIVKDDLSSQVWLESDSGSGSDDDDGEDDDSDSEESDVEQMEVDEK